MWGAWAAILLASPSPSPGPTPTPSPSPSPSPTPNPTPTPTPTPIPNPNPNPNRAEAQLHAARGALSAAEAARVKAKRVAAHRDEVGQATRKELLELQARHRALQTAMRDREAQRHAGSDLAKAAGGTLTLSPLTLTLSPLALTLSP